MWVVRAAGKIEPPRCKVVRAGCSSIVKIGVETNDAEVSEEAAVEVARELFLLEIEDLRLI